MAVGCGKRGKQPDMVKMIKLEYDEQMIAAGQEEGVYADSGLCWSKSRTRVYPSKLWLIKMIGPALRAPPLDDLEGTCEIWSERGLDDATGTIHLKLTYKVPDLPTKKRQSSRKVTER